MDWESKICPCLDQHNTSNHSSYQDLEREAPARPLDFPAPIVHRGTRITVNVYNPKRGEYVQVENLLIRCRRGSGGSQGFMNVNNHRTNTRSAENKGNEIGYCLRRKLATTVYGGIYKGVIMKKRKMLSGETVVMQDTMMREKSSSGNLMSIVEDNEFKHNVEEQSHRSDPKGSSGVWEATDEHIVIKVRSK